MRTLEDFADVSPLIRLDFTDDARWQEAVAAAERPNDEGFRACVYPIDDPANAGRTPEAIITGFGEDAPWLFLFADARTLAESDLPFLCVDREQPADTVRCVAAQLWSVENNLRLSNMELRTFCEAAGADGVFRGFARG